MSLEASEIPYWYYMLCFSSDKLFKVAHFFAHSENLALSFTFHLLWDTSSGALSVKLLRTESINRRWWSNPNRGQRLNVFVARFARGGRYYSRAGDKWRMHYSEHTNTQTIFLHNQNSSSRNTHQLVLQFQGKYNMLQWVHSIMMRPRSNPNTKAKIQCFSWAQVPALKSYWTSAPLAAVPTKIQNTEGIRK